MIAVRSLPAALGKQVRPPRAMVFDWRQDELARGACGTVHGAIGTGMRAAREILER